MRKMLEEREQRRLGHYAVKFGAPIDAEGKPF